MLEKCIDPSMQEAKIKYIPPIAAYKKHPTGYPRLSEHIALKPETGIYRRFDALNARHILYLQAELCILEKQLQKQEFDDKKDPRGKRSLYARDYQTMLEEPYDEDKPQLELIAKMHDKLSRYNEALIQLSTLQKIRAPNRYDLSDIQNFLYSEDMGPDHMIGVDAGTWGDPDGPDNHPPDLIGVRPREIEDDFSRIVAERAIHMFKWGLGCFTRKDQRLGRKVYYDSTVLKITRWISSLLASLLPIASILVLLHLESLKAKLMTIAAFNVVMSFCLTFFANARRADVFAVTAAFAAVQVVFVGADYNYSATNSEAVGSSF